MRSCFQIEDEATQIKSKYGKNPSKIAATASDLFSLPTTHSKPIQQSVIQSKPLKNLTKNEKLVLAASTQNEDTAEEALLALSLLQQYKRDPNFIQKELKDQAKKRDLVLGTMEQAGKKSAIRSFSSTINPQLTQEERHRAINEKREQRKREQRLKQLEESKERRFVIEPP